MFSLQRLRVELVERDRAIVELRGQVMAQREESVALGNLQDSLEATRAHLQKQLRTKEADCNRMAVQIRVSACWSLACCPFSSSTFPAISLGFTILGVIFVYVIVV